MHVFFRVYVIGAFAFSTTLVVLIIKLITVTSHGHHDVSYYQQLDGLSKSLFRATAKKILKLRIAGTLWGQTTGHRCIPLTHEPLIRKHIVMTSSFYVSLPPDSDGRQWCHRGGRGGVLQCQGRCAISGRRTRSQLLHTCSGTDYTPAPSRGHAPGGHPEREGHHYWSLHGQLCLQWIFWSPVLFSET